VEARRPHRSGGMWHFTVCVLLHVAGYHFDLDVFSIPISCFQPPTIPVVSYDIQTPLASYVSPPLPIIPLPIAPFPCPSSPPLPIAQHTYTYVGFICSRGTLPVSYTLVLTFHLPHSNNLHFLIQPGQVGFHDREKAPRKGATALPAILRVEADAGVAASVAQ